MKKRAKYIGQRDLPCIVLANYILWWIMPLFITTIFFYFQIYALLPAMALFVPFLFFGGIIVGMAAAAEEHRRE
jgi:hypothetical protein